MNNTPKKLRVTLLNYMKGDYWGNVTAPAPALYQQAKRNPIQHSTLAIRLLQNG